MSVKKRIGFMLWGKNEDERNAFSDEKYQELAEYFNQHEMAVETITYNNSFAEQAYKKATQQDGLLVWINPIEDGQTRVVLDQLLEDVANQGVMVSTKPDTIAKLGTKRVLYDTQKMPWGSDVRLYETLKGFKAEFRESLMQSGIRVLKQYRGDGGNGVYKVSLEHGVDNSIEVLHAKRGSVAERLSIEEVFEKFRPYFESSCPMIDQKWHEDMHNGVIRCYLSGAKVAGFGYQEINALYPSQGPQIQPGKRYYYTEKCGLFSDLKKQMEQSWIQKLSAQCKVELKNLPVLWDCDFFISDETKPQKYVLCEINVSCVSPFPVSAIPYMYNEVMQRL